MQTMSWINLEDQSNSIQKMSLSKTRFARRFIHHRLPTGEMQFLNRSRCQNSDIMFTNSINEDKKLSKIRIQEYLEDNSPLNSTNLSDTKISAMIIHPTSSSYAYSTLSTRDNIQSIPPSVNNSTTTRPFQVAPSDRKIPNPSRQTTT